MIMNHKTPEGFLEASRQHNKSIIELWDARLKAWEFNLLSNEQ